MKVSATEMNRHFGKYAALAVKQPVVIEKSGSPALVLSSYEEYIKLEDAYWGKLAVEASKEKSIGLDKTQEFLHGDD